MSGHGGFSVIAGGMNKPLPVELPKVEELDPGAGKSGALNIEDGKGEPAVADTRLDQASRLAAKLDTMLLKAAKSVAKPVDAEELKTTIAGLPKASRKAIDKAATAAERAYKAIGKFSGRQIAAALVKDNSNSFVWNERTPVGKAVKAALDAQAKLSEQLAQALNKLQRGTSAAVRSALEEAMFRNDRRASEIETLVCEFADMAEKALDNPAIAARLDKTLASLVPAQSLRMHGSEKIAADFRVSLAPLARRIDDLAAAAKERQLSAGETASIQRQLDEAANALAKAERDHVQKGAPLDSDLFAAARGVLEDFKTRLADVRRSVALGALGNFADTTFSPPDVPLLQPKFAPLLKMLFPSLGAAVRAQRRLRDVALEFIKSPTNANRREMDKLAAAIAAIAGKVSDELAQLANKASSQDYDLEDLTVQEMQGLVQDLPPRDQERCTRRLVADFHAALRIHLAAPRKTLDVMNLAYGKLGAIETQTKHLVEMRRIAGSRDASQFLTNKTLEAAFEWRLAVTTLVETRLNGLPDEDADPAIDGANAVSSSVLGSGAANTVYQVGFKDGSTYIFKPEAPGRQGISSLNLSKGSYRDELLVAQLNMAAQRTADAFGLNDVMTKTSVGAHGGRFGMFMEKAPGTEASRFGRVQAKAPGRLTADQIRELDDAKYAKVVGGLMRKANRLEWFDLLTGQGDRHGKNYLVEVDADGNTSLKGIDNDACFGKFLIGPGLFRLTGRHAKTFQTLLGKAKAVYGVNGGEGSVPLEQDPGISMGEDGTITVDVSKVKARVLLHCLSKATGSHSVRLPDHIDEELYNRLVAMESGKERDDYIASLRARLAEDQVEVAILRLHGAIAHAKALKERGCVVSTADWEKRDVQRKVAGPPQAPLPSYKGSNKACIEYANNAQRSVNRAVCPFRRDLLTAIAKPGWFEQ